MKKFLKFLLNTDLGRYELTGPIRPIFITFWAYFFIFFFQGVFYFDNGNISKKATLMYTIFLFSLNMWALILLYRKKNEKEPNE
jgi:hypothetical protein